MRPKGVDWDKEPLGTMTDVAMAQRNGVDKSNARAARARRGIPPFDEVTAAGGDVAFFLSKVKKAPGDGCWQWHGIIGDRGYGRYFLNQKAQRAP